MSKKPSSKSKSRRSSILKPPKPRNPLCDVGLNSPPPIDTTLMKNRRVSFANKNSIKEFTTDPEKNTIWHVSYEEANRSDQATNSVPQVLSSTNYDDPVQSSDLIDFNCTKLGDFDISAEISLSDTSNIVIIEDPPVILKDTSIRRQTVQCIQDNMAISHINTDYNINQQDINFKRHTINFNQTNRDALDISKGIVHPGVEFNLNPNTNRLRDMSETIPEINLEELKNPEPRRQTTYFNDESSLGEMEVTETLPGFVNSTVNSKSYFNRLQNRDIEVTKTIYGFVNLANTDNNHSARQTLLFNQELEHGDSQKIQLNPHIKNNHNSSRRTKHFNQELNIGDLEMIPSIPTDINIGEIPKHKRQTIHFNQESNAANLEMTQSIPTHINVTGQIPKHKRQTIHFNQESNDGDLEMTQSIHTHINVAKQTPRSKRQTIHFNQESNAANLEMTQSIPTHINVAGQIPKHKRQTIHFNQESNDGDLEMTQSIHTDINVAKQTPKSKRQTIHFNQESNAANLEMTQSIPTHINVAKQIPKSIRKTIHFNQESNDGDLEMTQSIPTHINVAGYIPKSKRQTIHFNQESNSGDLEMTQSIPTHINVAGHVPKSKRPTIHFNQESDAGNLEMTQSIPTHINVAKQIPKSNRQTILFNQKSNAADLEIPTQMYVAELHSNLQGNIANYSIIVDKEYNPSTKRQTILFNQESNMGDMEMTQLIPTYTNVQENIPNNSKVENKENIPITKRQRIMFNQESNMGKMEITQLIPTYANVQENIPNYSKDENKENNPSTKRQTILFNQESNMGDMEITQLIPTYANIPGNIPNDSKDENKENNPSTKRQTILFNQESNMGDMEMTQAIPTYANIQGNIPNVVNKGSSSTKRQTILFNQESNISDMVMTQLIPTYSNMPGNIPNYSKDENKENNPSTKRQTILFTQESNMGDMEMTQAIPTYANIQGNIPNVVNKGSSSTKRQTILFNQESNISDMVMTQLIPTYANMPGNIPNYSKDDNKENNPSTKRQTILFTQESNMGDMEMTQAIPTYANIQGNIPNVVSKGSSSTKRQTILFNQESNKGDMEFTQAISNVELIEMIKHHTENDNNTCNVEQSQAVNENANLNQSFPTYANVQGNIPNYSNVANKGSSSTKRQTILFNQESNKGDMEFTQAISNIELIKMIKHHTENDTCNMEQSQAVNGNTNLNQISTPNGKQGSNCQKYQLENSDNTCPILNNTHNIFNPNVTTKNHQWDQVSNDAYLTQDSFAPIKTEQYYSGQHKINQGRKESVLEIMKNRSFKKSLADNDRVFHELKESSSSTQQTTDRFNRLPINYNQNLNYDLTIPVKFNESNEMISNYKKNDVSTMIDTDFLEPPMSSTKIENCNLSTGIGYQLKDVPCFVQNNSIDSNICQRIRFPGDSFDISKISIENLNLTPAPSNLSNKTLNTFNLSKYVDSTEKLINYQIGNPMSVSGYVNFPSLLSTTQDNCMNNLTENIDPIVDSNLKFQSLLLESNIEDKSYTLNNQNNAIVNSFRQCELQENERLKDTNCAHNPKYTSDINDRNLNKEDLQSELEENERLRVRDETCARNYNYFSAITDLNTNNEDELQENYRLRNENYVSSATAPEQNKQGNCLKDINCTDPNLNQNEQSIQTNHNLADVNHEIKIVVDNQPIEKRITSKDRNSASNVPNKIECNYELDGTFNINKKDSFILVNSSSESDSCYEIQYNNTIKVDDLNNSAESFKTLVQKSYINFEALSPESISLVDSFDSDNSKTNFAAISFHAKEIERDLRRTVIYDNQQSNTEKLKEKLDKFKKMMNDLTVSEETSIVTIPVEEECAIIETVNVDILRERFNKMKDKQSHLNKNSVIAPKELTLEEQIKEKSEDTMWSIICLNNEEFQVFFMYDAIKFVVVIDRVSEMVNSVAISSRFCALTSDPQAIFVHRILNKKLSQSHIKSACGQTYNIFTFLDYITILGEQMLDIFNEFDSLQIRYGLVIDSELNATYTATNCYLRIAFEVTFNLNNLDSISEECLSVKMLTGSVRQATVKKLVKGCPQGIAFIRTFIMNVEEYLQILKNAKQSRH